MHEIRAYDFYQLRPGVYANNCNDSACFLDEGKFFVAHYRGEYFVYTIGQRNTTAKLEELRETKQLLTVDRVVRNYCDLSGNKIELNKKGSTFSLVILVSGEPSELRRLPDPMVNVVTNSFLPPEYTRLVRGMSEKPIDVDITSDDCEYVSLNISKGFLRGVNGYLLTSKLLSLPWLRFVYRSSDKDIEEYLRIHNVPKRLIWPITE